MKLAYRIGRTIRIILDLKDDFKFFLFKAKHGFKPTPDQVAKYFSEGLEITPFERFIMPMYSFMTRMHIDHENNDLTFMIRAVIQNRLHEVDNSTTKLLEYICKNPERNQYALFVSLLYTRRFMDDRRFAYIKHTPIWEDLISKARA